MKRTTNPTFALAMFGASLLATAFPATGYAERYNLCDPASIPDSVLEKTRQLPNFDKILEDLLRACPDAALLLAEAPTASVIPPLQALVGAGGSGTDGTAAGPSGAGAGSGAGTGDTGSTDGDGGSGTGDSGGGTTDSPSGTGNGCDGNCGNGNGNGGGNGTENEGNGNN